MNTEATRRSRSGSLDGEQNISSASSSDHSSLSSESSAGRIGSQQNFGNQSAPYVSLDSNSVSKTSNKLVKKDSSLKELDDIDSDKAPVTGSSISSVSSKSNEGEHWKKKQLDKEDQSYTDSDSSVKKKPEYASSITTESDHGLLRSILSDTSSEKIVTDIEAASPKDGIFSSSTDDELLRKFREQQVNKRFRPRSAKFRRDAEPEPENVQKIQSGESDRGSSKEKSFSSDSSTSQEEHSSARGRRKKKPRKGSANSSGKAVDSKKKDSSRSSSPSSSDHSSKTEHRNQVEPPTLQASTVKRNKGTLTKNTTGSETSDSLTTNPTSSSEPTLKERPPSRQGYRPKLSRPERLRTRTKPEKQKPVSRLLNRRSEALPIDSPELWPREPGHWWPHNEDCQGEKEIQRLIEYHKRKLRNLVAQEYLQRHLEIELRRAGAQFKQYERGPRPISPKQVRKFKERNITWVFLDGKLYNLNKDMGNWNTTQRGRQRNKIIPEGNARPSSLKSREKNLVEGKKSKRSVSFEKGAGRKRSSTRSPKRNAAKDALPKRKTKRRENGFSKGSRRSSLSSRGSAGTMSRSSSRSSRDETPIGRRSQSLSEASRSGSRSSSSASSKESKNVLPSGRDMSSGRMSRERRRLVERPKTALRRSRSASTSSRSSVDGSKRTEKNEKKRHRSRSSTSSSDREKKQSKSRDSKRTGRDEPLKLQRVIYTEELDKKLQRNQSRKPTTKPTDHAEAYNARPHDDNYSPFTGRTEERPRTVPNEQEERIRHDYNFYKDPNIPGHAFPYYYLSYLLAIENGGKRKKSNENTRIGRIVLRPAPVNKSPVWRTYTARRQRRATTKSKQRQRSPASSPKSRRKKTKSAIDDAQHDNAKRLSRSPSQDSESSSPNHSLSTASHPRIRPGSGPIKCSWKAKTESDTPKYPGSDHLLKNTDNPAILAWLRRKDAQMRARKQNELRKQRRKTAKLIDEENDLDEKHERALRQYELWKKDKDREILLRRRKEAKEANSAAFIRKENELKAAKRKERSSTSNGLRNTIFSELRSSSANPSMNEKAGVRSKPRPKSASTIGVTFNDKIEVRRSQRPRSATPQRQSADGDKEPFQSTENFFESFLSADSHQAEDNAATGYPSESKSSAQQHPRVTTEDRDAYQKWVRSSTPTSPKRSQKSTEKKKIKGSRRNRTKQQGDGLRSHNHSNNDLISNLAKRRIETILSNRKRVDTGLKNRPLSGSNGIKSPTPPPGSRTEPSHKKWRLREDDIIDSSQVKVNSQNSTNHASSSCSSDSNTCGERPKFSYRKKSPTKSTTHHRNPIVREVFSEIS